MRCLFLLARCLALALCLLSTAASAVTYDIVYVRQPRHGDAENSLWPEVFHPVRFEPGIRSRLLYPNGSEEVLVVGGNGAVTDPVVPRTPAGLDYAYVYDVRPAELNYQRENLPYAGADIFRLNLATRVVEKLTHGEFTPNTGAGHWDESNPLDPAADFDRLGAMASSTSHPAHCPAVEWRSPPTATGSGRRRAIPRRRFSCS